MTKFELIKECLANIEVHNCCVYKSFVVTEEGEGDSKTAKSECTLAVFWKDRDGIRCKEALPFDNFLNLAEGQALASLGVIGDDFFSAVQFDESYEKTKLFIKKDKDLVKYEVDRKIVTPNPIELPDEEIKFILDQSAKSNNVTIARVECSTMSDALNHIILS